MAGNDNTQPGKGKRKRTPEEEEFILDLEGCEELVSDEEEDELFGDLDDEYGAGGEGDDDYLLDDDSDPAPAPHAPQRGNAGAPPPDITSEFDLEALEAEYDDDVIQLDEESMDNPDDTPHFGDRGTSNTDEVDGFLSSQGMVRSESEFEFQNQGGAFGDAGDEWEGQSTFDEDMLGMKPLTESERAEREGFVPGAEEPQKPPMRDPFAPRTADSWDDSPQEPQEPQEEEDGPELEDFLLEGDDDENEFQQQPVFDEPPALADSGTSYEPEPDLGFDGFDEEEPALVSGSGESTFGVPSDDEMAKKWGDLRILGQNDDGSTGAELRDDWDQPAADAIEPDAEYDEYDPIYGTPEESEQASEEYYEEPDYTQFEDMHHDYAPELQDYGELSGAVIRPRRRRWLKRAVVFTVAAAVLLVWGGIALVKLRPDLPVSQKLREMFKMGSKQTTPMEVVRVERPTVSTRIEVPELLASSSTGHNPKTDPGTGPVANNNHTNTHTDPNPKTDPHTHPTPAHRLTLARGLSKIGKFGSGLIDKTMTHGVGEMLSAMLPKRPLLTNPTPPVNHTDPGGAVAITNNNTDPGTDPVPVVPIKNPDPGTNKNPEPGKNPVANNSNNSTPVAPVGRRRGFSRWPAVVRGTNALAQLTNGNFFVGRVMKIREYSLTLQLERGEISFEPDELSKLIPVAQDEVKILRGSPDGYVKLKNGNKFWAQILEDLPNVVTIQTGGAKITLPKSQVSEVAKTHEGEIKLKDDWRNDALPTPVPTADPKLEYDSNEPTIRVRINAPAKHPISTTPPATPARGK